MRILSSPKTLKEVPWILIIMFVNLVLFGEPAKALKCYSCTCWPDCVGRKNLFKEEECPPGNNACMTTVPEKEGRNFIAKQCSITSEGATEERKGGYIRKFCHTDLCNDQEAGGIPNPRSSNGGDGVLARGWVGLPAMIMAYVGRWLIN